MRPTMNHRSISAVRSDALFVSALQPPKVLALPLPDHGFVRWASRAKTAVGCGPATGGCG